MKTSGATREQLEELVNSLSAFVLRQEGQAITVTYDRGAVAIDIGEPWLSYEPTDGYRIVIEVNGAIGVDKPERW